MKERVVSVCLFLLAAQGLAGCGEADFSASFDDEQGGCFGVADEDSPPGSGCPDRT